jgi:hypothetical protein
LVTDIGDRLELRIRAGLEGAGRRDALLVDVAHRDIVVSASRSASPLAMLAIESAMSGPTTAAKVQAFMPEPAVDLLLVDVAHAAGMPSQQRGVEIEGEDFNCFFWRVWWREKAS